MKLEIGTKIHNKFEFELRDATSGELKEKAVAYNIILDSMWTRLLNRQVFFGAINFGTGTGELSSSNTTLFSHLGTKAVVQDSIVREYPTGYRRCKIILNPEEFIDRTITEVGVAHSVSTNALVTHAMLQDSEGNPISITKTETDVLTIYATIFYTISIPGNFSIMRPEVNSLIGYLVGESWHASIGQIVLGKLPKGDSDITAQTTRSYATVASSAASGISVNFAERKIEITTKRFAVTEGNGNIREIGFNSIGSFSLPRPSYPYSQYLDFNLGSYTGQKLFTIPALSVDINSISSNLPDFTIEQFNSPIRIRHTEEGQYIYCEVSKDETVMVIPSAGRILTNIKSNRILAATIASTHASSREMGVAINNDGTLIATMTVYYQQNGAPKLFHFDKDTNKVTQLSIGLPTSGYGDYVRFSSNGKFLVYVMQNGTIYMYKIDEQLQIEQISLPGYSSVGGNSAYYTSVNNIFNQNSNLFINVGSSGLAVYKINENDEFIKLDTPSYASSYVNSIWISPNGKYFIVAVSDAPNTALFKINEDNTVIRIDLPHSIAAQVAKFTTDNTIIIMTSQGSYMIDGSRFIVYTINEDDTISTQNLNLEKGGYDVSRLDGVHSNEDGSILALHTVGNTVTSADTIENIFKIFILKNGQYVPLDLSTLGNAAAGSAYYYGMSCSENLIACGGYQSSSPFLELLTVNKDSETVMYAKGDTSGGYGKPIFIDNNNMLATGSGMFDIGSCKGSYLIVGDNKPELNSEIKCSFNVEGIYKNSNYVLDVGGYIQFGGD